MSHGERLPARAVVLERYGQPPTVMPVSVDPPGAGELRVRVGTAGLCHTDVAAVRDARSVPVVLGHEGMGVVESVGPDGDGALCGTRVLLSWKTPCGVCRRCRQQRPHLCLSTRATASPRITRDGDPLAVLLDTGCFCDYVVVPETAVVPLPDGLADAEAALVGCAVATGVGAALSTARVETGDHVAVFGVGGVGLNVVVGAALGHAAVIVAVDPDPSRLDAARGRGATHVCAPADAVHVIESATDGAGVDVAFEVVGEPSVMAAAIDVLSVGGKLVLVGAAARDAALSFAPRRFMSRQQEIVGCIYGSLRPSYDLPALLDLCAAGAIPLADLAGDTIALEDVPAAFAGGRGIRPLVAVS